MLYFIYKKTKWKVKIPVYEKLILNGLIIDKILHDDMKYSNKLNYSALIFSLLLIIQLRPTRFFFLF